MHTDPYFTLESASEPKAKIYMYQVTTDDIHDDLRYHSQYARKTPKE